MGFATADWLLVNVLSRAKGVEIFPERLDQPLGWEKPQRVAVNGDLFEVGVPFSFVNDAFNRMRLASRHSFIVTTKSPARMLEFFSIYRRSEWFLPNVWMGAVLSDQLDAEEKVPLLLQVPAARRFVYCALRGPIDLGPWLPCGCTCGEGNDDGSCDYCIPGASANADTSIEWVIAAGETDPNAVPCHPDWVRRLRDQTREARVAFYFAGWGEWAPSNQYPDHSILTRYKRYTFPEDHQHMFKVGRNKSGRQLDGVVWDNIPQELRKNPWGD